MKQNRKTGSVKLKQIWTLLLLSHAYSSFFQHLLTSCLCVSFGNSCNISKFFIITFVMMIYMIRDNCYYNCHCFGVPSITPLQDGKFNGKKMCVLTGTSLPLLRLPHLLRQNSNKIRPINGL